MLSLISFLSHLYINENITPWIAINLDEYNLIYEKNKQKKGIYYYETANHKIKTEKN